MLTELTKETLLGGRVGKIHKVQDKVIRPVNKWTGDIHRFLQFLHEEGADFVPKPHGINENGEEVLSFVPGDVFNSLPKGLLTDTVLISAAKLLLKFHTFSGKYISRLTQNEQWMLPVVTPIEVMCHGDFAPYNVTMIEDVAFGIIDFDTLHPGSKMWDIVYAVYRWVPIEASEQDVLGEQIRKVKLFLDTYGVTTASKECFVELLIKRLEALVNFMSQEAANGNEDFELHIAEGHLQKYLDDIEYLRIHEKEIMDGIK